MKKQKACDLNVKVIYDIKVNIHMLENISVVSTLNLSPGPWKWNLLEILSYPQMCEDISKSIDKCRG